PLWGTRRHAPPTTPGLPAPARGTAPRMDRGNSKHGPRLDDEMEHEVRGILQGGVDTRAEEWHDPEPAGEDQPNPSRAPVGYERAGAPPGMTPAEVDERSEEHTSELQSPYDLVCRLLLEKKKIV